MVPRTRVPATKTFWKGFLRVSFVTIPVRLVSATNAGAAARFRLLHRESGERIRHSKVVPGAGKIAPREIIRGYEVSPGEFVKIENREIEALRQEMRHTIQLIEFVDVCDIDPLYFDKPYYVLPDGEQAGEGYRVIRSALFAERKAGIGLFVVRGRENLVALRATSKGLIIEVLRHAHDIKDTDDVFEQYLAGEPRPELVDMTRRLISRRSANFDPTRYRDHYVDALQDLVRAKLELSTGRMALPEGTNRKSADLQKDLETSLGAENPYEEASSGSDPSSHSGRRSA